MLKEHRNLIDAAMAINMDGTGGVMKDGKRLYFRIGTSEKSYLTFTLEATSPGGHGAAPGPDNAIYRLARGLGRLEEYKFPVVTTATTRASFRRLADLETGAMADDMRAVAMDPPDLAAAERLSGNVNYNAQLRTTCVVTVFSGGHAENALPTRAKATYQCRMMPGDTAEHIQATTIRVLNDPKIKVTMDAVPIISPESPPTAEIENTVTQVAHSMWPSVPIIPTMARYFTDGRNTRLAGIPTYDLSGVWADANENRAHGIDERIGIRQYDESVEYTYRLVKAVGKKKQ